MALANNLILLGSFLLLLSILIGLISSRIGAPLLLAFLALGMFFGEDGPGGLYFANYQAAYVIGSMALAIILFDGGLRTEFGSFRLAAWPALLLATVGVVVTAGLTGVAARWLLGLGWIESFLIGAVVGSTDAAAVFFLLHLHGLDIKRRVRAVLEVESGLNDPMAIFLTIGCVELLLSDMPLSWWLLVDLARQLAGGAVAGLLGGFALVWLINRLELANGLYPVLAMAFALFVFGAAQTLGASGFLAVYLVGLVTGNRRHRAAQLIDRFHDGLAWLAQMVMFVMLGLLVTPSALVGTLLPAVLIGAFLVLIARPLAVVACLAAFRFTWREQLFVAWVGLRGAVAIFLGTIPVLGGIEGAEIYFDVAFAVVLVSLIVQGWTIAPMARLLDLELPPVPEPPQRIDLDVPASGGRDLIVYTVREDSRAALRGSRRLAGMGEITVVSVIRDGKALNPRGLDRLEPGDCVLLIAPPEKSGAIDQFFAGAPKAERDIGLFGEFTFDGQVPLRSVTEFYDLALPPDEADKTLASFIRERLGRTPVVGDRLPFEEIEFVVQEMAGDEIVKVGIELEPRRPPLLWPARLRRWLGLASGAKDLGRQPGD